MITEVDEWEAAESRLQLPGKRRLVEHSVVIPSKTAETAAEKAETTPAPEEMVEKITRYSVVSLPGIGDICPFNDIANFQQRKATPSIPFSSEIQTNQGEDSVICHRRGAKHSNHST